MKKLVLIICVLIFSTAAFGLPSELPENARAYGLRKIQTDEFTAYAYPKYISLDNPDNHVTLNGGEFDGVGLLVIYVPGGAYGCSGSLLTTGRHVLTAAHCVTDSRGNLDVTGGYANFQGDLATYQYNFESVAVHPSYDGDYIKGNDIAVITLTEVVDPEITRYDVDRTDDSVGTVNNKVGFGVSGYGLTGSDSSAYPFGTKRDGQNLYDSYADTMYKALRMRPGKQFVPGAVLQFDFDDGTSAHDAFGFFFNIDNTGLGNNEVNSASGDSGGPTLNNGVVVGVTSYGLSLSFNSGATSDVTSGTDSSVGEFSGDTNVAKYFDFVDSVTGGGTTEPPTEPTCPPGKSKQNKC